MAYMFSTASGSRYLVSDGWLHQVHKPHPMSDPVVSTRIERVVIAPRAGSRASFLLRNSGRVTTNVVERVSQIPASWVGYILDHEDGITLGIESARAA